MCQDGCTEFSKSQFEDFWYLGPRGDYWPGNQELMCSHLEQMVNNLSGTRLSTRLSASPLAAHSMCSRCTLSDGFIMCRADFPLWCSHSLSRLSGCTDCGLLDAGMCASVDHAAEPEPAQHQPSSNSSSGKATHEPASTRGFFSGVNTNRQLYQEPDQEEPCSSTAVADASLIDPANAKM